MILTFNDVTELKNILEKNFSARLHFHDCCGGQYFTVDEPSDELKKFLTDYFYERKLKVNFSENGDSFSVEEIK